MSAEEKQAVAEGYGLWSDSFEVARDAAEVTFRFDASGLAGREVVAFERLWLAGEMVAKHADADDEGQTIAIVPAPEIGTTAVDAADLDHEAEASGKCVIRDVVAYKGLAPGRTYALEGALMDKPTGEPVESDGEPVTATCAFVADAADGSATVSFAFDAVELAGHDVVAFESLTRDGAEIASHADIDDEGQTVRLVEPEAPEEPQTPEKPDRPEEPAVPETPVQPSIGTLAADAADGDHEIAPSAGAKVVDTVAYQGLEPGCTYVLKGSLIDKSTGKPVQSGGKGVTADLAFEPEQDSGTVEVAFELDASEMAGKTLVAFEHLERDGEEVASHADIDDAGQSVAVAKPAEEAPTPLAKGMPQTGDALPILAMAAIAVAAAIAASITLLMRRRDPEERAAHALKVDERDQ